eukprot:5393366-Prymnesium_polylepis.1
MGAAPSVVAGRRAPPPDASGCAAPGYALAVCALSGLHPVCRQPLGGALSLCAPLPDSVPLRDPGKALRNNGFAAL